VITISIALIIGLPLPLVASQIIWLNFVTDGFLDISLAMEPKEDGLLQAKSSKLKSRLLDRLMFVRMGVMAVPMAIGALWMFTHYLNIDSSKALTISLTTLAVFQWCNAWNCRHELKSIFSISPFSNPFLIGATLIVVGLQMLAVYHPFFQRILHTTALSLNDWLIILPVAAMIVVVEEIRKLLVRGFARNNNFGIK
jgi:Ca2+-transporting ATPase